MEKEFSKRGQPQFVKLILFRLKASSKRRSRTGSEAITTRNFRTLSRKQARQSFLLRMSPYSSLAGKPSYMNGAMLSWRVDLGQIGRAGLVQILDFG